MAHNKGRTAVLKLEWCGSLLDREEEYQENLVIKGNNNSVALVSGRTIPMERLPLVGEVSANFLRIEGCRVVSVADPYGRNLCFLDRSRYFFFQVAP
jgi:hypothetical protein